MLRLRRGRAAHCPTAETHMEDYMDTLAWIVMANAAVWIGLGAYLAFLAAQQRALAARLTQWEMLNHD